MCTNICILYSNENIDEHDLFNVSAVPVAGPGQLEEDVVVKFVDTVLQRNEENLEEGLNLVGVKSKDKVYPYPSTVGPPVNEYSTKGLLLFG